MNERTGWKRVQIDIPCGASGISDICHRPNSVDCEVRKLYLRARVAGVDVNDHEQFGTWLKIVGVDFPVCMATQNTISVIK